LKSGEDFTVAENKENKQVKKTCDVCEGSGQICEFKGVSRFILSWDDCPICGGMGFVMSDKEEADKNSDQEEAKK
jgi:DnaJ-class molecular chaperone